MGMQPVWVMALTMLSAYRGRVLAFLFPRQNGPPAGLIGPCAKAGVVDPRGALDVLRRHLHLQLQGLGKRPAG